MLMSMVNVRKVAVAVAERGMVMHMVVWLLPIPRLGMGMLMVRVMGVPVSMLHGLVPVRVRMALCQVQPDAKGH